MAIVIEDGSGLDNAEAYISVADADTYFSLRGNAAWAALTTEQKEQALRRAVDYMTAVYGQRWKGEQSSTTQALDWPRDGVLGVASDVVPVPVQRANAELAVRASAGDLLADQGAQVKQETVGPISVTYADGARQWIRYAMVDGLLAGLLRDGGNQRVPILRTGGPW